MGIYKVGLKEIVCDIAKALDDIEGDFDTETLHNALKKCKEYPFTCDNTDDNATSVWEEYVCTP